MADFTAEEITDARAPIASLLSKSEKAQQKVSSGTWQYMMLEENIRALRIALPLIDEPGDSPVEPAPEELDAALVALDSMIDRVANTEKKFASGTSQHSLQRNRLKALRIARLAILARLGED